MTAELQAILDQVLSLPKSARMELLAELLESLDSSEDIEAAWTAELRERVAELRSGKGELVDWADAREQIHRRRPC